VSVAVDVAIVGGGVVGASLAWGMRSLSARLALVDAGDLRAASQGTFGLVWVQGKGLGSPAYVDWTLRSARTWRTLAGELREHAGVDVALEQPGGLHACLSAHEMDARAAHLDALFAQAGVARYDVAMLTRGQLAQRLPQLGPDVAGGSFSPLDGHCNPLRLVSGLHEGLRRAGVRRLRRRVSAIEPSAGRFRLHAGDAAVDAARVVIAAGRATPGLAASLGLDVPLVASTGEVMVLERMRRFLPFPLETIRQTDEGSVLVGDSHEPRDDAALDCAVLGAIARRAQRILPVLAGVRVVRAWAATRVLTPDGFPVYAQSPSHPGAFVAVCHSGVTLAAVHAHALAPAILDGALPPSLAPFGPSRLAHVQAAA